MPVKRASRLIEGIYAVDIEAFWLSGAELEALEVHQLVETVPRGYRFSARSVIEQPIVLLDGRIIDGRSRWREARRLGLVCPAVNFDVTKHGTHPSLFVASRLGDHLSEVYERAIAAVKLARYVAMRPASLATYDDGWPSRLHRKHERLIFAKACDVSQTEFERAWAIRDARILKAAELNLISLKDACKLHALRLGPIRVRTILDLPTRAERRDAINDRASERAAEKQREKLDSRQGELWPTSFQQRAALDFQQGEALDRDAGKAYD